jgi:hypothetical protein
MKSTTFSYMYTNICVIIGFTNAIMPSWVSIAEDCPALRPCVKVVYGIAARFPWAREKYRFLYRIY